MRMCVSSECLFLYVIFPPFVVFNQTPMINKVNIKIFQKFPEQMQENFFQLRRLFSAEFVLDTEQEVQNEVKEKLFLECHWPLILIIFPVTLQLGV